MRPQPVLRVSHPLMRIVGVIAVLLFTLLLVGGWGELDMWMYLFLVLMIALGAYLVLAYGATTMDSEGVTQSAFMGRFHMPWIDMTGVQTDRMNSIVFLGRNKKQLVIPWTVFWHGKDKKEMEAFMYHELYQHRLEMKRSGTAGYKWSRNTRVR
jgi:hypothetical protein